MRIIATTRRVLKDGTIKGTITVDTGHRWKEHIRYQYDPNNISGIGWQQWGAPTDVLCFTTRAVERLCYGDCECHS